MCFSIILKWADKNINIEIENQYSKNGPYSVLLLQKKHFDKSLSCKKKHCFKLLSNVFSKNCVTLKEKRTKQMILIGKAKIAS